MNSLISKLALSTVAILTLVNCSPAPDTNGGATAAAGVPQETAQSLLKQASDTCQQFRSSLGSAVQLNQGTSIQSATVNGLYRGQNVTAIRDSRGNFIFYGTAAGATVDLISNFEGNVILCDASLRSITGTNQGNISVLNGSVGSVSGLTGALIVENGSLTGSVESSNAVVVVRDHSGAISARMVKDR